MALRRALKKAAAAATAAVNLRNSRVLTAAPTVGIRSRNYSVSAPYVPMVDFLTNPNYAVSVPAASDSCLKHPDYQQYMAQLEASKGYDIDVDLGDHVGIIHPYRGSLDDLDVTARARFAIDVYNAMDGAHIQFVSVAKANVCTGTDLYYLTFHAIDDYGKMRQYRALVAGRLEDQMALRYFVRCYDGDADGTEGSMVDHKKRYKLDLPRVDLPIYEAQVQASEGFDVEAVDLWPIVGLNQICPFTDAQDDPGIISLARIAVEKYNKQENKQLHFVRVVKGNLKCAFCDGTTYYLTLEATSDSEKKLYQAKIKENEEGDVSLVLFRPRPKQCLPI